VAQDFERQLDQITDATIATLLRRILERLDHVETSMGGAFVGGDLDGHRRAHEQFIADLQLSRELRQGIMRQVITGSVWALLITAATAAWTYLKHQVTLP
tara:strand:+ start:675 stop:974 length:300 start_codon:yes stop_codon:yes gene_type:complete